jgi:hypothetical protein
VRFGVLSAVRMKIMVFWDLELCNLIERYEHFGAICSLRLEIRSEVGDSGFL